MSKIKLIYGPMFSGKSAHLIELIEKSEQENKKFLVFKPMSDKRTENIYSRNGKIHEAISINEVSEIFNYDLENIEQIFIDEINFFTNSFLKEILELKENKIEIILSGLDRDYRTDFFPNVKEIFEVSDEKNLLKGKCFFCENNSLYTGRKLNGEFDKIDSPTIIPEDLENKNVVEYFASCKSCHPLMDKR